MYHTMMKMTAFSFLLMTLMFTFLSQSWMQLWIILEINMMSFIPILFNNKSKTINSMIKYFFIQSLSSSVFMVSILTQNMYHSLPFNTLILISMLTKLGMFPLFMWFPQIATSVSWLSNSILMTMQKFIPMFIMMMTPQSYLLLILIIPSIMVSITGMWSQSSLKSLMAFSSINHLCWMSLILATNNMSWMFYLLIYSVILITLIINFKLYNLKSTMEMSTSNSLFNSIALTFLLLSLGGMPPFLGFLPKWMIINLTIHSPTNIMLLPLILSSMVSMVIYIRLIYPSIVNTMMKPMILMNPPSTTQTLNILALIPTSLILL